MPTSPTVQHLAISSTQQHDFFVFFFLRPRFSSTIHASPFFLCSPVFPGPVVPVVHAGNHLEAFDSRFRSVPLSYTFRAPAPFPPLRSPLRNANIIDNIVDGSPKQEPKPRFIFKTRGLLPAAP